MNSRVETFNARWPLDRALADTERWWREFHLCAALAALTDARRMFARGDEIGIRVGMHMVERARELRMVARRAVPEDR